jgi:hypothetical protein
VANHVKSACSFSPPSPPPPEGYYREYEKAFADLDVGELVELYVEERSRAGDRDKLEVLDDAQACSSQAATSFGSPARSATLASKPRSARSSSAAG